MPSISKAFQKVRNCLNMFEHQFWLTERKTKERSKEIVLGGTKELKSQHNMEKMLKFLIVKQIPRIWIDSWIKFLHFILDYLYHIQINMAFSCGCPQLLWSIIWIIVLIFIGWPVGAFCAGWYLLFSPCDPCCDWIRPLVEILEKGVKFPHFCGEKCYHQTGCDWEVKKVFVNQYNIHLIPHKIFWSKDVQAEGWGKANLHFKNMDTEGYVTTINLVILQFQISSTSFHKSTESFPISQNLIN